MNRRQLLKGLLASSGAVVAAKFGAPEWMGDEIKEELLSDLSRTSIAVPGQVFDNRPIWTSIAGVRQVWVDEVSKKLARQIDRDILESLKPTIDRTVNTMVRAVDLDLRKAEVEEGQKIIIQTPKVHLTGKISPYDRRPIFELKAGLEKSTNILAEKVYKVGYIQEEIIV